MKHKPREIPRLANFPRTVRVISLSKIRAFNNVRDENVMGLVTLAYVSSTLMSSWTPQLGRRAYLPAWPARPAIKHRHSHHRQALMASLMARTGARR